MRGEGLLHLSSMRAISGGDDDCEGDNGGGMRKE